MPSARPQRDAQGDAVATRKELAERVAAERAAQGLPRYVEDEAVLRMVADMMADVLDRPERQQKA